MQHYRFHVSFLKIYACPVSMMKEHEKSLADYHIPEPTFLQDKGHRELSNHPHHLQNLKKTKGDY